MQIFRVTKIEVKQNRIVCFVKVCDEVKYTNDEIAKITLAKFPNLNMHKCKNLHGEKFCEVIHKTSLPHLFEHLVIDMQISALPNVSQKIDLFGFSQWENEEDGLARVEVSYYDDLVALEAIKNSADFINDVCN